MARTKTAFFCRECGNETPKWQGQCPACREWNSLVEEPAAPRRAKAAASGSSVRLAGAGSPAPVRLRDVEGAEGQRWPTGLAEFDFVLGGGIVPGSVVLVGGEPGIGKSTILLQVAARLEGAGRSTLYVSGEESAHQVKLRADRMDQPAGAVTLLAETELDTLLLRAAELNPRVLLVDSIQTVYTPELEGAPGNVGQVRECAARLQRFAKQTGTAVFLVGHVTKGGGIAGPKTLEHIVDTVLYFEAAGGLDHRVLRATKNRFGGVDEIGVFRMTAGGLSPVGNPSELFLGERSESVPGSAVVATMEGTRPLLVEVQALAAKAAYGAPQRVSAGIDPKRLALLLAVLEKRAGLPFGQLDVFLNVVGGLRLAETAGDAAVAVALASSVFDRAVPADVVVIGELGLGGELRAVGQMERRLAEAARMGFRTAYLSPRAVPQNVPSGIRAVPAEDVRALVDRIFA
ncbi:MAG TPA: DNA repair protein RadA [Longimicrobium sp.]|jgi:DNA repair protein RadA/Sms|uniref:DNA repair protein RadA n=1 Tax=Longimicrobium sp. TaxID=2029185 RepID=UPI002EDA3007